MKTRLLLFILISVTMPVTSFAQSPVNCNFGDSSTPLDKIFEKDIAAKTFTEKYPNATRYVAMEDSYPINGELSFTVENNSKKEMLLIKFNQNENGCYRPYAYHYSFNDGIIDVTVKNPIMNFGEIINLIKLDDKKIEDFYTKNCNQIQLDFVSNGESKPYFCKYDIGNSIEMILQKHVGGTVEIHIPDKAMDALFYDCEIIDFIVLDNGEEINYELDDTDKKIFKMELPSGYHKIEIIGFTYLSGNDRFCGSIWSEDSRYISPLLQTKIGVEPSMVQCNDDLILIQKYDNSTACVTDDTGHKLVERGWTTCDYQVKFTRGHPCGINSSSGISSSEIMGIGVAKDGKIFDVKYLIKGATIQDMIFSNHTNSLVITIDVIHEGNLEVTVPRDLLDARMDYCPPRQTNAPDDRFFVMLDGEEIFDDEILTTVEARTLRIPFDVNSEKIEIIGTCFV